MPFMVARPLALFLASHPGPVVGVTAASAAYALAIGRGGLGSTAVASAVLAGQLSVGWHNDWLDAARDGTAARRDKPIARGDLARSTVGIAAGLAAVATVPLSLLSGWHAALVHVIAVACAWGYNAGIKATALSFLPFTVSFGLLPVFVSLGRSGAPPGPWWAATAAALLGTGAHFMNALPDLELDAAAGVRGLPHRIGKRASLVAAASLLLVASAVLVVGAHLAPVAAAAGSAIAVTCVVAAVVSARRPASRAPFGLTIVLAVVDVVLLLVAGHNLA